MSEPKLQFFPIKLRYIGWRDYLECLDGMQKFTLSRTASSEDEIWIVQHPPVFTLGLNGKTEHVLDPGDIPVINCDRGGQVTYHGPGQLVVYFLLDIERRGWGVQYLVNLMEQIVIDLLAVYGVVGLRRKGAPGVYVNDAKIAALGLRVKRGRSYHGLSLNVDMDLRPFLRINPCGYPGLTACQLVDLNPSAMFNNVRLHLRDVIIRSLVDDMI